ncbi:calcium-activated chloride channel regulator 2-like, partial [Saccoglossus kowalevskii]
MYRQYLPNIVHFCDNETMADSSGSIHNEQAPTKHNRLCDEKNIWQVMREHVDFADDANPPRDNLSTVPSFRVVKQRAKRNVLLLDISGSMSSNNRIEKLGQVASIYILLTADDDDELGMVVFNDQPSTRSQMVTISESTRLDLLELIPTRDDIGDATGIGSGLSEAIDVLENGGNDAAGGCIILVSDGEENRSPYIDDVQSTIVDKGVCVHTIALGVDASHNMEQLPLATDGKSFYYSENPYSNALNEAFITIAKQDTNALDQSVQIYSNTILVDDRTTSTIDITVDSSIGRETQFIFSYLDSQAVQITLNSPSGTVIDQSSSFYVLDTTFQVVRISIPGTAETGSWSVSIYNPSSTAQYVSVTVQSKSRDSGQYPISVTSEWSVYVIRPPEKLVLYVTIAKGTIPVLNAAVIATIERPNSDPIELTMADNGAGADITKDDGTYTSYFTAFNGDDSAPTTHLCACAKTMTMIDNDGHIDDDGHVNAANNGRDTVISPSRRVGFGSVIDPDYEGDVLVIEDEETGSFQRAANGGSFTCSGTSCSGSSDLYPPSKIIDLQVKTIAYRFREVTIEFTAPGDDLDYGNVTSYEIWMHTDFSTMQADHESGTYVFCVVAVDDVDNKSPRSNIVTVSMNDFNGGYALLIALLIL